MEKSAIDSANDVFWKDSSSIEYHGRELCNATFKRIKYVMSRSKTFLFQWDICATYVLGNVCDLAGTLFAYTIVYHLSNLNKSIYESPKKHGLNYNYCTNYFSTIKTTYV